MILLDQARRCRSYSPSYTDEEQAREKGRTLRRREVITEDTQSLDVETPKPPAFFAPNNSDAVDGAISTTATDDKKIST